MQKSNVEEARKPAPFGRRKVAPRVCIAESKKHIRTFLSETLEELGFIACECSQASDMAAVIDANLPDLIVLGMSAGGVAAGETLQAVAANGFGGKVLLLGPSESSVLQALLQLGEELGIAMLPPLGTPFGAERLLASVAEFLPAEVPPCPPVDAVEAMRAGWLELWYQPKIAARTLALREAEGLIRIRHPTWGVVPPAYFIPGDGDPHLRALSDFVIGRAIEDWRHFVERHGPVELAINLPIAFLEGSAAVDDLCRQMPEDSAFEGLIIEINGIEAVRNLPLVREIAGQVRPHHIAISIDDLGAEWPSLVGLDSFPFVELKVDRKFITGCADDRLKCAVCRQILDLADGYGARTVAEGVETRADFIAVREMGFDLVQGFLFAKPMAAKKFARTMLGHPVTIP
jgi:EAL domain-containing protein (putative c-di-GMP-specific phosphodiesterase class I)/CheY-like chemotaxis protein